VIEKPLAAETPAVPENEPVPAVLETPAAGTPPVVPEPETIAADPVAATPADFPSVADITEADIAAADTPITETLDEKLAYSPPVIDEQSITRTEDGKVDESKIEIKDPLLDELALPDENAGGDEDEFTWDIDDLK
jgi:hypothetical protein